MGGVEATEDTAASASLVRMVMQSRVYGSAMRRRSLIIGQCNRAAFRQAAIRRFDDGERF